MSNVADRSDFALVRRRFAPALDAGQKSLQAVTVPFRAVLKAVSKQRTSERARTSGTALPGTAERTCS
jgi:hypothetical protein